MSLINKRIKERREQLKYSQDELANKLGYKSRSTIAKIESGKNDIPLSKIQAFADVLQTTVAYLMEWEEKSIINIEISYLQESSLQKYYQLDKKGQYIVNEVLEAEYIRYQQEQTIIIKK